MENVNVVDIEHPKPTEDLLLQITNMATQQDVLEKAVLDLEALLAKKKKDLEDVQVNILPELMSKARLTTFQNEDGLLIEINPGLHCKVPDNKNDEAMKWLEDNGFGRIISRAVIIDFAKEDEEKCTALLKEFEEREQPLNYKQKKGVHHATLKAQVKKILQAGKLTIPKDVFGIHERPMSIITYAKK